MDTNEHITAQQLDAVQQFADKYGIDWKNKLLNAWYHGWDDHSIGDGHNGDGHLLRQLRNNFGPRWLQKFDPATAVTTTMLDCDECGQVFEPDADEITICRPCRVGLTDEEE